MYWPLAVAKHRNAKYMYGWRALKYQLKHLLTVQLGRFLTKECLEGQKWWECTDNYYL